MSAVVLTERDHAVADLAARMCGGSEARERPRVSGQEAAALLGICYARLKSEHIDAGDIFYIPGTKRLWRSDVLKLKRKREGVGGKLRMSNGRGRS